MALNYTEALDKVAQQNGFEKWDILKLDFPSVMDFDQVLTLSLEAAEIFMQSHREEYGRQKWVSVEDKLPDDGIEVLGCSPDWIHPDFNTEGIRICFVNEGEWKSAKWDNDQDSWHTHAKWCCEDNGGKHFDPTHWTPIPPFKP